MARAKQTARSEARRRYRQSSSGQPADGNAADLDFGERKPEAGPGRSGAKPTDRPNQATARPGFTAAFRGAYRPANLREDVRALPRLLRSRAFLAAVLLTLGGGLAWLAAPGLDGSAMAWQLLVYPGQALAPQLVAGFFAPRASYLLGFLVGLIQGATYLLVSAALAARLGVSLPPIETGTLVFSGFVSPMITGALFAAAAAWYRRFLALSSPRRASAGRTPAKSASSRKSAGR